jgi:hypothetical protein
MLGNDEQYNSIIRNYVIAFGSIFNDITIVRRNSDDTIQKSIKVPLAYGPSEKFLALIYGNDKTIELPRIAFEITTLQYDSERKLSKLGGHTHDITSISKKFVYNPVPYDIEFDLFIMVKNADDGTQILEQILPYFTPSFSIPIKELSSDSLLRNTPLVLNMVSLEDDYDGDFYTKRSITWTISFTMKGFLYGNDKDIPIIREITSNVSDTNNSAASTSVTTPDPITSTPVDDYGFSTDITNT